MNSRKRFDNFLIYRKSWHVIEVRLQHKRTKLQSKRLKFLQAVSCLFVKYLQPERQVSIALIDTGHKIAWSGLLREKETICYWSMPEKYNVPICSDWSLKQESYISSGQKKIGSTECSQEKHWYAAMWECSNLEHGLPRSPWRSVRTAEEILYFSRFSTLGFKPPSLKTPQLQKQM